MRIKIWLYPLCCIGLLSCSSEKKTPVKESLSPMESPGNLPMVNTTMGPPPVGGLNPKHGEPGHRCDIAVGAKLPQAASQVAPRAVVSSASQQPGHPAANTQQLGTSAQPTVQPQQRQKGEKLNPPHGQPNHRCDIAVGAPLRSKPLQSVTTTKPVVQVKMPTTGAVPLTNEQGQKLNPPHGKPNHRCDIAVGAPLI